MRVVSILFLAYFLLGCVSEQKVLTNNYFIIDEGTAPWIIAHGGSKHLWPENTMLAFDGSVQLGIDALELDVNLTKDEILVCHHDETIDRMSDGTGKVIDFNYSDLLQYNFGDGFEDIDGNYPYKDSLVQLPTVHELFVKHGGIPMVIEIKNEKEQGKKAAEKLYDLIQEFNFGNEIIIASFHDEVLRHLKKYSDKKGLLSTGKGKTTRFVLSSKAFLNSIHFTYSVAVQIPLESSGFDLATERTVKSAHKHNMAVHYWTLNTKAEMEQAINIGADGIMTDRPDLMKELLIELGY